MDATLKLYRTTSDKKLRTMYLTTPYIENISIPTVQSIAKKFYKRIYSKLHNRRNYLISKLSTITIPSDPKGVLNEPNAVT